jgi:acyl-CoA reductase-like NAD-dependent aldehyde dehydrogenase
LAKICYEAGMPEDVLQLSNADIPELLEAASDNRVNGVNLTASVRAGQSIAKAAGFKKMLFELGGIISLHLPLTNT